MMLLKSAAPTPPTNSYADKINAQFSKNATQFVDIHTRITSCIKLDPTLSSKIKIAIDSFKNRNTFKKWADLRLPRAINATLAELLINITLQRYPDVDHFCTIITKFEDIRVMPICVYIDPSHPGKYVAFEGQHTAIALYLIALMVLGLRPEECTIPIVMYDTESVPEIRKNLIGWATDSRKGFDLIDTFQQKIFGVRIDGTTDNDDWNLNNDKQIALEQNGLFVAHPKFGNAHLPGAVSRLVELVDPKYPLVVTQNFAKYVKAVCNSNRPVQPKEMTYMYAFFDLCRVQGISVTSDYIKSIARSVSKFGQNFIELENAAKKARVEDWKRYNRSGEINLNGEPSLRGITYPYHRMTMTFLVRQLEKNHNLAVGRIPVLENPLWIVDDQDLL